MIFSPVSVLCIIGYSIASRLIVEMTGVPDWGPEHLAGMAGIIPVALHCTYLDARGA